MKRRIVCGLAIAVAIAFCFLKSYEVLPTQASWSGSAPQQGYVGNTFVANFDSICYCDVFVGDTGASHAAVKVDVYEHPNGVTRIAKNDGVAQTRSHVWLHLPLTTESGQKFVRGKEYLLKVTRPGDSVNFYVDRRNPYTYGHAVWSGGVDQPPPQTCDDICLRLYGKARVGDEFAVQSNVAWTTSVPGHETIPYDTPVNWDACIARESAVGVKYDKIGYGLWGYVQPQQGEFKWGWLDTLMMKFAQHGVGTIMSIRGVPGWASCSEWKDGGVWRKSGGSLPSNIFEPVRDTADTADLDSINSSNYLAKYAYELTRRYGPKGYAFNGSRCGYFWDSAGNLPYQPMLMYESYPELPLCAMRQDYGREDGAFWRRDTTAKARLSDSFYRSLIPGYTLQERKNSFLQVAARVIIVVDSAVKMACKYPDSETLSPKTMAYIWGDGHVGVYSMPDWLNGLKSHHADEFFDLATYFAYEGLSQPEAHAATFLARRDTMTAAGYAPRSFVLTEFSNANGYPYPRTQRDRAYHLQKAFAAIQAANAIPGRPIEAAAWFTFTKQYMSMGFPKNYCSTIIDDSAHDWQSWEPAYTYEQWSGLTNGADIEGRIPSGDSTFVLQYEDTLKQKFWIAWAADPAHQNVAVSIPVRSDTIDSMSTQTEENPNQGSETCATDGWLSVVLDTIPLIVRERPNISRPDLVADSMRLDPPYPSVGMPLTVHVRFHNAGNAPTPDPGQSEPGAHPIWVVLRHNGDSVAQASCLSKLYPGDTGYVSIYLSSVPWYGHTLFEADVNPGQRDVELGMDDNAVYKRLFTPLYPTGVVDAVVPPGGKTDATLLPLRLESHSWESDSTGQTSADSARVIFAWFGQHDSVVRAEDTTAWFPFCSDTVLEFPRGCGKFNVYAQFRDSGCNDSPAYPDSADTVVVFDTVAAAGSIVIGAGTRFAPSANCTLRLAAYDSASGVYGMRFSNRAPVNLARNGTFAVTDGSWDFTNGGYDSSLQMAVFSVSPSAESRARQFVPAESISAHYGDSCVLEASILALMHDGDASGDVSFWFYSTRQDTSLTDTLFELVDSASYSGDLLSLTGRYNLATRFLLTPADPDSGWVWRGGMVKVRAQGVTNGTGHVWTDNVSLNLFQPQSGCTWWGTYDTLAAWDMGSTAGQHVIRALYLDEAGTETGVALADTVILDPTPPFVHISLPQLGQYVSGITEITGWAYDSIEVASDTWFASRRLVYRHQDSTNWLPVTPDSVSYSPAYPNENPLFGPAVHLGYWNTGSLPIGNYYLKAVDDDSVGHSSSHTIWVVVSNGGMDGNSCGGPEGGGTGLGEGSVYVGSGTGTILHLSDDLTPLDSFTASDSGSNAYVTAILEVGDDSLLILDARNRRIHKLHRNGQKGRRLVSGLSLPVGVTKDDNGNFWLADKGLDRIGKFRRDGTLVFTRGGPGRDSTNLNAPEAIAVKNDLVYVADAGNSRIAVWDTTGNFQGSITGDFRSPTAVMVTDSGAIYLTDGSDGKLKGITPLGGNIVAGTASGGSKLRGLVLSENGHSVFTLAPQPNTVYKLRIQSDDSVPGGVQSGSKLNLPKLLSLAQPFPNPARTRLSINYALPRQTRVSVKLYDIAGKLVTTLATGDQKPGYYNLTWNRQDAKGRSCACGVYFCTLSAENKRFSRKVVLTE